MFFDIDSFANDIASLSVAEVAKKYKGRIPCNTGICEVIESLEEQGLLEKLIRSNWKSDGKDTDGIYLIQSGQTFEVFVGERGLKHWKQVFGNLKAASISFLDLLLNELLHEAPDSKIK